MVELDAPIPRRHALRIIGTGALVTGAGVVVAACGSAATASPGQAAWVPVDVDLASVPVGTPTSISLSVPATDGQPAIQTSTWLIRDDASTVTVYDPRCTHQSCAYAWSAADDRFDCFCHKAAFAKDGAVLFGPPPRPLDQLPTRTTEGRLEVEVPAGFSAPTEST
jgi:succinate dehydrogenase / fumarate reductase iron-sulfur subunit